MWRVRRFLIVKEPPISKGKGNRGNGQLSILRSARASAAAADARASAATTVDRAAASISRPGATISMAVAATALAGTATSMAAASISRIDADDGIGGAEKLDYHSAAVPFPGCVGHPSLLHRANR